MRRVWSFLGSLAAVIVIAAIARNADFSLGGPNAIAWLTGSLPDGLARALKAIPTPLLADPFWQGALTVLVAWLLHEFALSILGRRAARRAPASGPRTRQRRSPMEPSELLALGHDAIACAERIRGIIDGRAEAIEHGDSIPVEVRPLMLRLKKAAIPLPHAKSDHPEERARFLAAYLQHVGALLRRGQHQHAIRYAQLLNAGAVPLPMEIDGSRPKSGE
jgi:hypothetical protein